MDEKLQKVMLICSSLFGIIAMSVMLYYSANKTIVIAEETVPKKSYSTGDERRTEGSPLQFIREDGKESLLFPLPAGVKADDIVIENRYMNHEMHIVMHGVYDEFYRITALSGNVSAIQEGFYRVEKSDTRIILEMNGVYEHKYIFEDGRLQLIFLEPWQAYDRILVLDAAHGGKDSGEVTGDLREKDITLEIAEKVREKLSGSDVRIYFTRIDDSDVPIEKRVQFVNDVNADMLISIRVGADRESPTVYGIQAYYNSSYFIPFFGNGELADLLERETVTAAGGKANGLFEAKEDDVLLQNAWVPAAAIQTGYLTNEEEAALFGTEEYRERLAEGIADAVKKAFLQIEEDR